MLLKTVVIGVGWLFKTLNQLLHKMIHSFKSTQKTSNRK